MGKENEKQSTMLEIDNLLEEVVEEMKGYAPVSFATEIVKIETTRKLLVHLYDMATIRAFSLDTSKPKSKTSCKNAILEAKQALIDLDMRESDVDHILVAILARNIQLHFPTTSE